MIVTHVKETQHDIEVAAACEDGEPPTYCPKCHILTAKVYKHGTTKQLLMDLPVHGKRVGITLIRDRYRCQDCGKTFVRPLPGLKDGSQMTERLIRYIQEQSLRKTFTAVSDEVGVDEKTVRNLFHEYIQRLDAETIFETPKRMGIDLNPPRSESK